MNGQPGRPPRCRALKGQYETFIPKKENCWPFGDVHHQLEVPSEYEINLVVTLLS